MLARSGWRAAYPVWRRAQPAGVQRVCVRGLEHGPNQSDEVIPQATRLGLWGGRGHGAPGYPRTRPIRREGLDLNLQERLDELYQDRNERRRRRRDIGFAPVPQVNPMTNRSQQREYLNHLRKDKAMEKAARERTLQVDLEDVKRESLSTGAVFQDIFEAAEYYGVYEDLFDEATFTPNVYLTINYDFNSELVTPIHRGNIIKPKEATQAPSVQFSSDPDSLWTLVLTNPDGHLTDENSEYLHWMVGNIRGNDLNSGQVICDYLQPFPPFGSGYHRFNFLLYKQEGQLDLSAYSPPTRDQVILKERSFCNKDFFAKFESQITPAGLAFFQSDYDSSLTEFFHEKLLMKEPRYEYHFIQTYRRPWTHKFINHKEGFNLFLDKFRDPMEIEEEVVRKKLRDFHPFKGSAEKRLKYPNAHYIDKRLPSWRRREIERERLRHGVFQHSDWNELRRDPTEA